jgi:hypothetical protein
MVYDRDLANRLREVLAPVADVTEKAMFGGLAFMIDGRLTVSASRQGGLLVRIPPEDADALTAQAGVERAMMGGRTLAGWLRVDPVIIDADGALDRWVMRAVAYVTAV